ncbi:copper amine oxidase N-terminal domain-containing protein [Paenibacillus sp. SI8]|uniref:copper amine oxidase N-terminal domain-containing protein n=1 Tax=unclassified Paenibacillus TaxID=185978 RepID=UPI00346689EA
MRFKRLILTLSVALATFVVPRAALAAADPFVDPANPNGDLVFNQNVTASVYQADQGSQFRTAYTFSDGSVGVFATTTLERPYSPLGSETVEPEKLWKTPPTDTLYRLDAEGNLLEKINIPTLIEHPFSLKGPRNIVRSNSGTYWAILQGTMRDTIGTPRGIVTTDLRSHEIVSFDAAGAAKTVDIQPLLPEVTSPAISYIALSEDKLFVFVDAYMLVLDAQNASLLSKVKNDLLLAAPIALKHGDIGFFKGDEGKLYAYAAPFPGTLTPENASGILNFADFSPALKPVVQASLTQVRTDEFAYDNYGITTVINPTAEQPVLIQALQSSLFTSVCVNCPKQLFLYVISPTKQAIITESVIEVQEMHPIRVTMNGRPIVLNSPVYYDEENGHVWLPLRETSEALGAKVGYDSENRIISLQLRGQQTLIHQDSPEIEMKTMITYGKAYVSIRALAELLGIEISWNQQTYTAELGQK